MTDPEDKSVGILSDLSDAEKAELYRRFELLEHRLSARILKRVAWMIAAFVAILTVAGLVSFSGLKTEIVATAASRLATDPEIRNEALARLEFRLDELRATLTEAQRIRREMSTERREASVILSNNLDDILVMVEELQLHLRSAVEEGG